MRSSVHLTILIFWLIVAGIHLPIVMNDINVSSPLPIGSVEGLEPTNFQFSCDDQSDKYAYTGEDYRCYFKVDYNDSIYLLEYSFSYFIKDTLGNKIEYDEESGKSYSYKYRPIDEILEIPYNSFELNYTLIIEDQEQKITITRNLIVNDTIPPIVSINPKGIIGTGANKTFIINILEYHFLKGLYLNIFLDGKDKIISSNEIPCVNMTGRISIPFNFSIPKNATSILFKAIILDNSNLTSEYSTDWFTVTDTIDPVISFKGWDIISEEDQELVLSFQITDNILVRWASVFIRFICPNGTSEKGRWNLTDIGNDLWIIHIKVPTKWDTIKIDAYALDLSYREGSVQTIILPTEIWPLGVIDGSKGSPKTGENFTIDMRVYPELSGIPTLKYRFDNSNWSVSNNSINVSIEIPLTAKILDYVITITNDSIENSWHFSKEILDIKHPILDLNYSDPVNSEIWTIEINASDNIGIASFSVDIDINGGFYPLIPVSNGLYQVDISENASSIHLFVYSEDIAGNVRTADLHLPVSDRNPPIFLESSVSLLDEGGDIVRIEANVTDNRDISNVYLLFWKNEKDQTIVKMQEKKNGTENSGEYYFDVPMENSEKLYYTIIAEDNSGNPALVSGDFTLDERNNKLHFPFIIFLISSIAMILIICVLLIKIRINRYDSSTR